MTSNLPPSASNEPYSTISTTTSLGRVRGFTIDLLFHLKDGPKRCCDLAEISGKNQDYVHRYLRNMRKYGLVKKQGILWNLSVLGVDFLSYLNIVYNNIIEYGKKKERKKKEDGKKMETSPPKKLKQISFSLWLQSSHLTLDSAEKKVVEVLVDHFNRTGSKFLYFNNIYEMAEKFQISPDQVNQVIMNLKQDHIVYSYRNKHHAAWKIGLYKAFIEGLKASQEIKGS